MTRPVVQIFYKGLYRETSKIFLCETTRPRALNWYVSPSDPLPSLFKLFLGAKKPHPRRFPFHKV